MSQSISQENADFIVLTNNLGSNLTHILCRDTVDNNTFKAFKKKMIELNYGMKGNNDSFKIDLKHNDQAYSRMMVIKKPCREIVITPIFKIGKRNGPKNEFMVAKSEEFTQPIFKSNKVNSTVYTKHLNDGPGIDKNSFNMPNFDQIPNLVFVPIVTNEASMVVSSIQQRSGSDNLIVQNNYNVNITYKHTPILISDSDDRMDYSSYDSGYETVEDESISASSSFSVFNNNNNAQARGLNYKESIQGFLLLADNIESKYTHFLIVDELDFGTNAKPYHTLMKTIKKRLSVSEYESRKILPINYNGSIYTRLAVIDKPYEEARGEIIANDKIKNIKILQEENYKLRDQIIIKGRKYNHSYLGHIDDRGAEKFFKKVENDNNKVREEANASDNQTLHIEKEEQYQQCFDKGEIILINNDINATHAFLFSSLGKKDRDILGKFFKRVGIMEKDGYSFKPMQPVSIKLNDGEREFNNLLIINKTYKDVTKRFANIGIKYKEVKDFKNVLYVRKEKRSKEYTEFRSHIYSWLSVQPNNSYFMTSDQEGYTSYSTSASESPSTPNFSGFSSSIDKATMVTSQSETGPSYQPIVIDDKEKDKTLSITASGNISRRDNLVIQEERQNFLKKRAADTSNEKEEAKKKVKKKMDISNLITDPSGFEMLHKQKDRRFMSMITNERVVTSNTLQVDASENSTNSTSNELKSNGIFMDNLTQVVNNITKKVSFWRSGN